MGLTFRCHLSAREENERVGVQQSMHPIPSRGSGSPRRRHPWHGHLLEQIRLRQLVGIHAVDDDSEAIPGQRG